MPIKKEIKYDETEEVSFFYEAEYIIDELIENGVWLIKEDDKGKIFKERYPVQLKDFGIKQFDNIPPLKKGQKIKITFQTTKT